MWTIFAILVVCSCLMWITVAISPDRAYTYREKFEITEELSSTSVASISNPLVTVLIPARNEETVLPFTLPSLFNRQYSNLEIILIDDASSDRTREVAEKLYRDITGDKPGFRVVAGRPLPSGWAGKIWALSQGIEHATGEWLLFTDADIYYPLDTIAALIHCADRIQCDMLSLMVRLTADTFWEKISIPAFVYFFKLLYPFKAVNHPRRKTAAAAGGCILIKKQVLQKVGGLNAIQNALIDDVALAKLVKSTDHHIALLMASDLLSKRSYKSLTEIWQMVRRSAFTELKYSYLRLGMCILAMTVAFIVPIVALLLPISPIIGSWNQKELPNILGGSGLITYAIMCYTFYPTLQYFRLRHFYILSLPLAGVLYLAMTIDSAFRYSLGIRSNWKERSYKKNE